MLHCPHCGSRFFKTLELRYTVVRKTIRSVLYKRRCKRCKQVLFIRLQSRLGKPVTAFTEASDWNNAYKVSSEPILFKSSVYCPLVSEYTRLIRASVEDVFERLLRRPVRLTI